MDATVTCAASDLPLQHGDENRSAQIPEWVTTVLTSCTVPYIYIRYIVKPTIYLVLDRVLNPKADYQTCFPKLGV